MLQGIAGHSGVIRESGWSALNNGSWILVFRDHGQKNKTWVMDSPGHALRAWRHGGGLVISSCNTTTIENRSKVLLKFIQSPTRNRYESSRSPFKIVLCCEAK